MIRGGNVEFRFNLPYNFNDLAVVQIEFWQDNYNGPSTDRPLPIFKSLRHCVQGSKPTELSVILNQEETLRFTEKRNAYTQLRAKTTSGIPIITRERLIAVYPARGDSVLDEDIKPSPDYTGFTILDGGEIAKKLESEV